MATFHPRPAYTEDELRTLYPKGLQLQLVQVILRHGERSPVSARFQNAGLPAYWPYCNAARRMRNAVLTDPDGDSIDRSRADGGKWDTLEWRRRLETFGWKRGIGDNAGYDGPVLATAAGGAVDGVCNLGELTDQGRATTLALGRRLRRLYVEQLGFMPRLIADADSIYLRATPIPRALESVQQAFTGMYPAGARTQDFPPPTIVTRNAADETLHPNEGSCKRFKQLAEAYGQRTADRWNASADIEYLNGRIGKWMPDGSPRVAVDSKPRLSGIMDTVNATLAHPAPTRLPKEFYDQRVRDTLSRLNVEEWYGGYRESREYRTVGIGALAGDLVERMVANVDNNRHAQGLGEIGDPSSAVGRGGEKAIRFGMAGAHDTTLAALLTSLGAFDGEPWPPFTSHVALELFKEDQPPQVKKMADTPMTSTTTMPLDAPIAAQVGVSSDSRTASSPPATASSSSSSSDSRTLWQRLTGSGNNSSSSSSSSKDLPAIARRPLTELTAEERARLDGYYVRVRYNDRVMRVPGCAPAGAHRAGDDSLCTLEAFKRVVDGYTPPRWRDACLANLDKSPFPDKVEPAGY